MQEWKAQGSSLENPGSHQKLDHPKSSVTEKCPFV